MIDDKQVILARDIPEDLTITFSDGSTMKVAEASVLDLTIYISFSDFWSWWQSIPNSPQSHIYNPDEKVPNIPSVILYTAIIRELNRKGVTYSVRSK